MSLPLHNGALAVLEMQFPGKIMQGVKGCVCMWGRGVEGESKLGVGREDGRALCTLRLCSSERERETWKERMKTEMREEKSGGGEESAGVKNHGGWRRCVCAGGGLDLQIFLDAQIKKRRRSESRRKVQRWRECSI